MFQNLELNIDSKKKPNRWDIETTETYEKDGDGAWKVERKGEVWDRIRVERWGWLDNEEVKDTMEREGGRSGQREGEREGEPKRE